MTQKVEERVMAEIRSKNVLDRKDFNSLKSQAMKSSKNDCQMELISIFEEMNQFINKRKEFMMKNFSKLSKINQEIILGYIKNDEEDLKEFQRQFDIS